MEAADIILVEAAISDGGNEEAFRYLQPATYTQLLAEYILVLPRKPFVMWLTASWRGLAQHKALSAEPLHLDVLAPMGISHTSMLRMFEPVEGRKDLFADWLTNVYFQDCCHPSSFGHKLIAAAALRHKGEWQQPVSAVPPRSTAAGGCASWFTMASHLL